MIPTPLGARNPNVVRDWWSIVERNKVTIGGAVPTTLAAIMNVPRDGHDLSSLKVFVSGGSTVPVELIRRIETEIGVPVVEGYGMTEVHCYSTMNPMHGERRPGSVGLRLPYTEVRIADVAGDGTIRGDCAGTIGHVLMRGPQVTPGYLDPRHDKGAMLADGWLDSGDLGRLDADGYVWLTGRSKDLIIRGGHNIDPIVIEEALVRHPAVETAAAVGLPDTYAGELPMAFVQLKPDATATPEELREFCRQEIPERAAVPVQVVPIPTMPLTGVGKIFKPALRLDAAQRAFDAALMPLRAEGVKAEVMVGNDPTHGTLATVRRVGRTVQRGDREALRRAAGRIPDPALLSSSSRSRWKSRHLSGSRRAKEGQRRRLITDVFASERCKLGRSKPPSSNDRAFPGRLATLDGRAADGPAVDPGPAHGLVVPARLRAGRAIDQPHHARDAGASGAGGAA